MMFLIRNDIGKIIAFGASLVALSGCGRADTFYLESDSAVVRPGTDMNRFFECLEARDITLVAAHRGGEVENSIAGMDHVLSMIPAIMEVDVNVSSDGVLFLMHDDTLDRTTTGTGRVSERDWNYISSLMIEGPDGETHDSPPTLEEALAWADAKTILELDIKQAVRYEDVVNAVKFAGATDRVIYIAYTAGQARRLHQLHPEAMISADMDSPGELAQLITDIPFERLLGWTGNTAPQQDIFDSLNAVDVEVIFGTLGGRDSIDNRLAATGNYDYFAQLARDGVDIIATDMPVTAYVAMQDAGLATYSSACGVFPAHDFPIEEG